MQNGFFIQSEGKFKMIFLSLYIDISYVVVFKLYKSLNSQNSNYLRQFESFLCENDFHLNSSQLLVRRNRFIKAPHRPSFPLQISLDMASRKAKPSPQNSKENYLFFILYTYLRYTLDAYLSYIISRLSACAA